MEPQLTGDEIVISGIAGRFPNSENVNELQKNLLNKIDCVGDSKVRWDYENPKVPPRIGTMKDIDKFDRIFFGFLGKMLDLMDPMIRMTIETAYEAVADAGINPRNLKGKKTAVFTGSGISESEMIVLYEKFGQNGLGLIGVSRAMLANRISFFFGLNGPSVNIDSSCCGGASALYEGFMAIKDGRAESAIIGASNVVLHPNMSLQLFLLGLLSPDGKTKSFDDAADGYARSEATVVLFLQKARDAKRIYAEVKNASTYFGSINNKLSISYPTHDFQANIMKTTLKDCGISGKDISLIEATGSGLKDVDAEEIKAIDEVYNEGRKLPLPIGSVTSNLGSCSAVNPLNGIIKVITAMESGYIPPNLHFQKPSDQIPALKEGRCKVVTELTPWTGDYAVVNSLAFTGASANIILKDFKKEKKNKGEPKDNLPRLVICSGCTEEAVDFILNHLENRSVDVEMLQLIYDIFKTEIPAHMYRGYTLLPPHGLTEIKTRGIQHNPNLRKEIWYMFSGMGSQWVGMGEALLQIPIFAQAIEKCDKVLKPKGIDIFRIITEKDPKMFDNIINSFVGIAAIQIGLVDLLDSIGLKPDFLIGHSVGELGCAYADGCFTAEEMVLAALCRGLASVETEMPKGSMAAVGLGYEEIKNLCPPDIDVACHNSADSSTISGPADSMKAFVAQLKAKKIFAKEVACSNIAYHSRYIAPASEKLRKYLQEIIPNPKPRTNRWVSSSVPREEWNSPRARLSSAEYHTNNLLNSVLFAETAKSIASNAVVIEIAPHGLLQAIVKKSLPENVINISLTKRNHSDNVSFLFDALGKIYNTGYNITVSNLYPKVNYPVSRGTPSISSLIRWDHSTSWNTHFFKKPEEIKKGVMNFIINLKDEKWQYLNNYKIDEKVVFPTSLYLKLAWDVLKSLKDDSELSVVYQNVYIHKHQVEIQEDKNITLKVMVQKGTGVFEVTKNEILLCSGILQATETPNVECSLVAKKADNDSQDLSESDIYTELEMRGLQYSGPFRNIRKSSANGCNGALVWKDNWTTFLEGIIQMHLLANDIRKPQVPIKIRKIVINLKLQEEIINKSYEIPVTVNKGIEIVKAGGVLIEGIVLTSILHKTFKKNIVTKKLEFSSGMDRPLFNLSEMIIPSNIRKATNWIARQINHNDLKSISWVEGFHKNDANTIKVEYSAVNQSDILLATTKTEFENTGKNKLEMKCFGQEYSGISSRGSRVMGISENSTLSNYITADTDYTWKIPENWTLEDAATVPLAYAVAYLALVIKGDLQKNESVFVYDSASSIGQAIINIAFNITPQVFVGHASDINKKNLMSNFKNIPEHRFINASENFADQILAQTEGKGADLIIYNGDDLSKIETWLMCVKRKGNIIIIGHLQQALTKSIGMQIFLKVIDCFSIIPTKINSLDLATKKILSKMIENGLAARTIKPLPRRIYSREMLKNAFIDGATNNVYGKIIVKVQPEDGSNKALTIPCFLCNREGSYLIIEGLSDFGLELVNFLVVRGAKNIVIVSESKNTRAYSNHRINLWREYGVSFVVREELDLTQQQNGNVLLEEVNTLGTVDGIFDLQRIEHSSKRSSNSKYLFTKYIFEESKQMCPDLRHFVVFATCKNSRENIDDVLLREIDLTKICQEKSKGATVGLLILLGPIAGIAEWTTKNETNVPLLSIPSIIEQMDNLIESNASIVSVCHKSLEVKSEKVELEVDTPEETSKSKFYNYISAVQLLTTSSMFRLSNEKQT
ncbi:fatty acid synthase-like [Leptopilina boulardi]|uniref:fatty acid synthase-like n=1 Tax=Leptopilina boulardi TaxID=63433 RepID=UPI0021F5D2F6|nr:fatty acid synthase-like [Leptopilina boulardi]